MKTINYLKLITIIAFMSLFVSCSSYKENRTTFKQKNIEWQIQHDSLRAVRFNQKIARKKYRLQHPRPKVAPAGKWVMVGGVIIILIGLGVGVNQ